MQKFYALAEDVYQGVRSWFVPDTGIHDTFDPRWMSGSHVPMVAVPGSAPRLAVKELIDFAPIMGEDLYLALEKEAEMMGAGYAAGQDAEPTFDERHADIKAVLDAAPWQMHPDYGTVWSASVPRMDAEDSDTAAYFVRFVAVIPKQTSGEGQLVDTRLDALAALNAIKAAKLGALLGNFGHLPLAGRLVTFEKAFADPVQAMAAFVDIQESRFGTLLEAGSNAAIVGNIDQKYDAGYTYEGLGSYKIQFWRADGRDLHEEVAAAKKVRSLDQRMVSMLEDQESVPVETLSDSRLDWAVAMAKRFVPDAKSRAWRINGEPAGINGLSEGMVFNPSINKALALSLIEGEGVSTRKVAEHHWVASSFHVDQYGMAGPDLITAGLREIVANQLGLVVDVPKLLPVVQLINDPAAQSLPEDALELDHTEVPKVAASDATSSMAREPNEGPALPG